MLDPDELLARLVDGAEEFVELGLHRRAIAVLAVLDQEHHQEGDDGRAGVDNQLRGIREFEDRPGHRPDDDHQHRRDESQWLTGGRRGLRSEPVEETSHPPETLMQQFGAGQLNDVTSIATEASVITEVAAQPKINSEREAVKRPITWWRETTIIIAIIN